ncbi:hypothetical protein [uncultured Roseobacter sp.]|uniref:hypothetical protein n=1 Tax=uncultured Roseobacter sp. TaxID=114847 RepID=UPI0026239CD6|nr:hypothetical protein [uncultured Roseobacter sp.]
MSDNPKPPAKTSFGAALRQPETGHSCLALRFRTLKVGSAVCAIAGTQTNNNTIVGLAWLIWKINCWSEQQR